MVSVTPVLFVRKGASEVIAARWAAPLDSIAEGMLAQNAGFSFERSSW